jgi:hypothetical protein
MHRFQSRFLTVLSLVACSALSGSAAAQSNSIPGTDVNLGGVGPVQVFTHQGAFPNGLISIGVQTTACNAGTVQVPWEAAMDPDHPFIGFLYARDSGGRFEQISDRSYVKHGFFALANSQCTPCQGGSGTGSFLGIGCSDTYSTGNNGDNYWLGPPEEIDPWLGTWNPVCSHFDRGEPDVGAPNNCNGLRSLTQAQASALGPVGHRVQILDSDLNVAGADFYVAAQYVIEGEPTANRGNNLASKKVLATWNGSSWSVSTSGSQLAGSILLRWSGATVNSATNGSDDGRLWVGVKVSSLGGGQFRYEYAVHNQDNQRGVGALRIPLGNGAIVSNVSFHDPDSNVGNDWTAAQVGGEFVFSTGTSPQPWNTIYNFGFDCNAAAVSNSPVHLDQFLAGGGLPTVSVVSVTPGDGSGCPPATSYCTAKVSSGLCVPDIGSSGSASMANPNAFQVVTTDMVQNVSGINFFGLTGQAAIPFQGGTMCVNSPVYRMSGKFTGGASACAGTISYTLQELLTTPGGGPLIQAGSQVYCQTWSRDLGDPFGSSLSNALEIAVCQ